MIRWISKPLALAIHDRQLAEHGGGSGVRDDTLLDSALARAQQLHAYGDPPPDLADLAASLAFGLARNHPFFHQAPHPPQAGRRRGMHARGEFLVGQRIVVLQLFQDAQVQIIQFGVGKRRILHD